MKLFKNRLSIASAIFFIFLCFNIFNPVSAQDSITGQEMEFPY